MSFLLFWSKQFYHLSVLKNIEETYPEFWKVPTEYHDLKELFNKVKATSLPPHMPYDHAIDLIPGTTPPRGSLYSLSGPEQSTM